MTPSTGTSSRAQYTEAHELVLAGLSGVLKDVGLASARPESILNPTQLRNAVIRKLYNEGRVDGTKSEALIYDLGKDFCLSFNTVHAILFDKTVLYETRKAGE